MGRKSVEIVGLDVKELIADLNSALADEWNAVYQYWIASKIAMGINAPTVIKALEEILKDEQEHANELAERITQLNGTPITNPKKFGELCKCKFIEPPKDPSDLKKIVDDVLLAEACAIEGYNKLAEKTRGKDHVTYHLAVHIMQEEIEHEAKFELLLAKL
ncbi:MAG: ferritin-like domain-containing protein [archaeon]|nr:ferritin-like domain-containing protein [archaeon]MCP8319994.1 ferritin-like domain-containing protein [archaeon]